MIDVGRQSVFFCRIDPVQNLILERIFSINFDNKKAAYFRYLHAFLGHSFGQMLMLSLSIMFIYIDSV